MLTALMGCDSQPVDRSVHQPYEKVKIMPSAAQTLLSQSESSSDLAYEETLDPASTTALGSVQPSVGSLSELGQQGNELVKTPVDSVIEYEQQSDYNDNQELEPMLDNELLAKGDALQNTATSSTVEHETLKSMSLYFKFDQIDIDETNWLLLQQLAAQWEEGGNGVVLVEGFADKQGSSQYNQQLSQQRADYVTKLLLQFGLPIEQVVTKAYGSSKASESHRDSRRVDVTHMLESEYMAYIEHNNTEAEQQSMTEQHVLKITDQNGIDGQESEHSTMPL
jgi:outer membrane protein OmpA-like peptidoglycan-associated protein